MAENDLYDGEARGVDDYRVILRALAYVFMDIRATNSIKMANSLADVFHNTPMGIYSSDESDEIISKIELNSRRHGCEDYVRNLLNSAGYKSK
ncbi:hypothetical protein [Agrobacterium vitis]|uniref:hypothetical protein n=1 Tax=Agrobacterium vitis TaxID=373 RepID=UPI003D2D457F